MAAQGQSIRLNNLSYVVAGVGGACLRCETLPLSHFDLHHFVHQFHCFRTVLVRQLHMAALRKTFSTLLPCSRPHASSLSQLLFLRTTTSKVFVKAFSTTEEKLAEVFSQYGSVLKADIVMNKAKNRSKGFGYVTFAKEEEALKAHVGMNGKILHGRVLYVDIDPPKR